MGNLKTKIILQNQKGSKRFKELSVEIPFEQIVSAIMSLNKKERESFIEDLLAATSPEYLESIEEAREDYKERRVYDHNEVFGESE